MEKFSQPVFLASLYFLFTFGYTISTGFYHVGELIILLICLLILFLFYFRPQVLSYLKIPGNQDSLIFILAIIASVNVALVGARLGDSTQTNWQFYSAFNRILSGIALFLVLSFFVKIRISFLEKYRLILLLGIALLIRIFSILSAPNPTIDVFYILRDGPKEIFQGRNPYEMSYPAPYGVYIPQIIFVYGPLAPFLFLPSVLLFNDPRFTLVVADFISVLVIYLLAKELKTEKIIRNLLMIIFMFHPLFPFMTEQAWMEPTITMFFFASVLLLLKGKSPAAGIITGAVLGLKSVYLIPVITFLKNMKAKTSAYITALLTPLVLSAPFLILNKKLFLERTQSYVINQDVIANNLAPTDISLNLSALFLKYAHFMIPSFLVALLGLICALFVIVFGIKKPAFAVLSVFLVFAVLFMLGPFVFLHYWAFLGNLLILSTLLLSHPRNKLNS